MLERRPAEKPAPTDPVRIADDAFRMGSDRHYPEEGAPHPVRVSGFAIDPYPVTIRQFAAFVAETGYRTVAEGRSIPRLVWEWTTDWYSARHPAASGKPCCAPGDPRGGSLEGSLDPNQPRVSIPRRVVKGGLPKTGLV